MTKRKAPFNSQLIGHEKAKIGSKSNPTPEGSLVFVEDRKNVEPTGLSCVLE